MANQPATQVGGFRPQVDRDAPWSPHRQKRPAPALRERAVVYVIGPEDGDTFKVGCTTNLKERFHTLRAEAGEPLHIAFWAEFQRTDAFKVERAAIKALRAAGVEHQGERFKAKPEVVAEAVLDAARLNGLRPISQAGWPGAWNEERSEIEEVRRERPVILYKKGIRPGYTARYR